MYGVIIPERSPERVQPLPAEDAVEGVGADEVSDDPPGDRHHPQHEDHHHQDVVHQITPKLAETPGNLCKVNMSG